MSRVSALAAFVAVVWVVLVADTAAAAAAVVGFVHMSSVCFVGLAKPGRRNSLLAALTYFFDDLVFLQTHSEVCC